MLRMTPPPEAASANTIPIRNVWHMLLYAWDMGQWIGSERVDRDTSPGLTAMLAKLLTELVTPLLHGRLQRAFDRHTAEIQGIRGRLELAQSIKRLSFQSGRAVCTFPQLTQDTLANRLLRATLTWLAASDEVDQPGEAFTELRHHLLAQTRQLDVASPIRVVPADFDRLQLGRNDAAYQAPMTLCRFVWERLMPLEAQGRSPLLGLLHDRKFLAEVFEAFLRNYYARRLRNCKVGRETLRWPLASEHRLVPQMKTDITIESVAPVRRRLVIDAKFYAHALVGQYQDSQKFSADNLYQLYAYLRTQEQVSEAHRTASGMLLYPWTSVALDETLHIQGHEITLATLDLTQPWAQIEGRLDALVAKFQDEGAPAAESNVVS